ncbi:MAG: sigma 54-interacting transcriptional regulator [Desulfohalobiaceae bacterium]|nr:sigma 54-interacting transcriptional regulator [Desulfohalobiaceae bacterium]
MIDETIIAELSNHFHTGFNLKSEDFCRLFEGIMYHSRDGLFVTDHEGNIVMLNKASEEMLGLRTADVLGRNVRDLVHEGYYDSSVTLLVLEKQRPVTILQTSWKGRKVLTTGIPIVDDHNELKFVLVNDRDVSLIKMLKENLEPENLPQSLFQCNLGELGVDSAYLESIVFSSQCMEEVIQTAVRAAKFNVSILLTGKSGVGKSLIARLIHQLSPQKNGPFIDLNCGSLPSSLLESELFGYEPGAFTGASAKGKKGLLECANQGILFLDEIGEMDRSLQVKLLKFLETKSFFKVGSTTSRTIDTRIIAATNQDLDELIRAGSFRKDLFFRLNVISIHIPPLSERKEEIEPLVKFFLDRLNQEFQTHKTMSEDALNLLREYKFPGNVRELENLIKRLITLTDEDEITPRHLPRDLVSRLHEINVLNQDVSLQKQVAAFETQLIKTHIRKYGSQRKAAKALGINQSTLSRKLRDTPPHILH